MVMPVFNILAVMNQKPLVDFIGAYPVWNVISKFCPFSEKKQVYCHLSWSNYAYEQGLQ